TRTATATWSAPVRRWTVTTAERQGRQDRQERQGRQFTLLSLALLACLALLAVKLLPHAASRVPLPDRRRDFAVRVRARPPARCEDRAHHRLRPGQQASEIRRQERPAGRPRRYRARSAGDFERKRWIGRLWLLPRPGKIVCRV